MKTLYLKVSHDKYRLPMAVADSKAELIRMTGTDFSYVYACLRNKNENRAYIAVNYTDEEWEGTMDD